MIGYKAIEVDTGETQARKHVAVTLKRMADAEQQIAATHEAQDNTAHAVMHAAAACHWRNLLTHFEKTGAAS